jgi:hypothetical protein
MGAKLYLFTMEEEQAESFRKQGVKEISERKRKDVTGEWRRLQCITRTIMICTSHQSLFTLPNQEHGLGM